MARKTISESARDWGSATSDLLCSLGWHFFFDNDHCTNCGRHKREVAWLVRHKGAILGILFVAVISLPEILAFGITEALGFAIAMVLMLAFFCAVTYGVSRLFGAKSTKLPRP